MDEIPTDDAGRSSNWRPLPGEITLGDIAVELRKLAARGVTRESVLFVVDQVEWPLGRDQRNGV